MQASRLSATLAGLAAFIVPSMRFLISGGLKKAYPLEDVRKHNPVQDQLGVIPVLLVVDNEGKSVRCFNRTIEGQALDLYLKPSSDPPVLMDTQSGSEWDFSGRGLNGPMLGKKLERIQTLKDFWFDWKLYNAETQVFSAGRLRSAR
jgi:Protein of unknown function (DUF3179)